LVEILDNKQYERSADIYSFGILLWVIMTQQRPYIEVMNSWDIAADGSRRQTTGDPWFIAHCDQRAD
jgi:hypothetical protein